MCGHTQPSALHSFHCSRVNEGPWIYSGRLKTLFWCVNMESLAEGTPEGFGHRVLPSSPRACPRGRTPDEKQPQECVGVLRSLLSIPQRKEVLYPPGDCRGQGAEYRKITEIVATLHIFRIPAEGWVSSAAREGEARTASQLSSRDTWLLLAALGHPADPFIHCSLSPSPGIHPVPRPDETVAGACDYEFPLPLSHS